VRIGPEQECLCRILFKSSYFRHIALVASYGLLREAIATADQISKSKIITLLYTTVRPAAVEGAWRRISSGVFLDNDRELSRRIVANEVWVEDQHCGPASEEQLQCLPQMKVFME